MHCLEIIIRLNSESLGVVYHQPATSFRAPSCSFKALASSRKNGRVPPFHAFRDEAVLPASVLGPVECSHGLRFLHCSASNARCSGVLG